MVTSVSVQLQGSLDNVNWFNLSYNEQNDTYTSDGTYSLKYQGYGEINYIRLYWASEAGGTSATIDVKAKVYPDGDLEQGVDV